MIKEIKYSGYTANPSDYEAPDGDLAVAINCLPENGSITPILPPARYTSAPNASFGTVIYIHRTSQFTHYIIRSGNDFYYSTGGNHRTLILTIDPLTDSDTQDNFLQAISVGNTLIFISKSQGLDYWLWKSDTNGYKHLGSHIPDLPISFGLKGAFVGLDEGFHVGFANDGILPLEEWNNASVSELQRDTYSSQIIPKVNKFIAQKATDENRFFYPFFVRYALRLFDGSHTMHSAPVLMLANTAPPIAGILSIDLNTSTNRYTGAWMCIYGLLHTLDFAVAHQDYIDKLKEWSDIVVGVDIFVSAPIHTYDQNGTCGQPGININFAGQTVCKFTSHSTSFSFSGEKYQKHSIAALYSASSLIESANHPVQYINLPVIPAADIESRIKSNAQFYLIHSASLDRLSTARKTVTMDKGTLSTLLTRTTLSDDFNSHSSLFPTMAYAFNSRLNLSGVTRRVSFGYHPTAALQFSDGYIASHLGTPDTSGNTLYKVRIHVYINKNGKEMHVMAPILDTEWQNAPVFHHHTAAVLPKATPVNWLFYPDTDAYKAVIEFRNTGNDSFETAYELPLQKHDFLNGSFFHSVWDTPASTVSAPGFFPHDISEFEISEPNKIYTSEVNNPFFFPMLSTNSVGTGSVLAMCTAAKPLSQGQFGDFPMYAFTTEGIWAMTTNAQGAYTAVQPITRDVCLSPDSITQLDSSVLFTTHRGIMIISGSQTQCISESINSDHPFNALDLPGFGKLHDMLGHDPVTDKCLPTLPFSEFLKQCRMIYDYVHQRVIVYAPGITYAYVFSLKSKLWGMTFSNIASHLNSYPEALAVDNDNNIVNFSQSHKTQVKCLLATRPLKLDSPDILKTIDTVIQRGHFRKGHLQSVLYGSRDLYNWHLIWSSKDHCMGGFRGTPYKYFRIALICNLAPDESILGASVRFTPRLTNQPR